MTTPNSGKALIVDDEVTNRTILKSLLIKQGYQTFEAENGLEAIECFSREQPDIIFMDIMMPTIDGYEATKQIKADAGNRFVPIIFLTALSDEDSLNQCIEAGGDDFLIRPYDNFILKSKIRAMQRITSLNREVQGMYSIMHREYEIAESVFVNAIQGANIKNPNIQSEIRPASTFSGDMKLSAYSPSRDLLFLIGDFTGHGLSAAIGAMPVSEVFHAMTSKGFSAENIITAINRKLKDLLPVGMFFAVQIVEINYDLDRVRIFNAGMPEVLIIDGQTNDIKHRIKSASLPLGIVDDIDPGESCRILAVNRGDRILMFSDGLTEARNEEDKEFGEKRLENAILEADKNCVYQNIFDRLDGFCGNRAQVDDVTLAEITCVEGLLPRTDTIEPRSAIKRPPVDRGEWHSCLKLSGKRLRATNPVPILVNQILEMEKIEQQRQSLFTVITELYVNALDHGVLGLDSTLKSDASGFARYFEERKQRLELLDSGHVIFHLSVEQSTNIRRILLCVEDSGEGFDFQKIPASNSDSLQLCGRGILMIKDLCESLTYEGNGNIARAILQWQTE